MRSNHRSYLSVLSIIVVLAGCQTASSTTSLGSSAAEGDKPPTSSSGATAKDAASLDRFVGNWVADDGGTFELTPTRMKRTYKIADTRPQEGRFDVVSLEGDVLVITPFLELGEGKTFKGDNQRLTLKDGKLDVRNVKNQAGDTYKRAP